MNLRRVLWRLAPLLLLPCLFALPAHSQTPYPNAQGWCEAGAQNVITSGLTSTTLVQASFPQCTVSVSIHGGGAATIYSDDSGDPLSNPFTATTSGRWQFFAATNSYDVTLTCVSACVPPNPSPFPVTFNEINVGVGSGGGGSCSPLAPLNGILYNSNGTCGTAAGISTPDGNNLLIAGPDPHIDVTAPPYNARAVSSPPTTTATCNGSTGIQLAASSGFINGDGIVVYGCGTTVALTTPVAPTLTSGISNTPTVPDATLTVVTGATAYHYKYFAIDQHGGMTVASPAGNTTTGPATLGMSGPITVTSASLSGTTLTLTLPGGNSLAANMLIHFSKSTNAILDGWYNISSVGGGGTSIVINNTPIQSTNAAITSTGGNIAFASANQLTITPVTSAWEYGVCRAIGAGSYSLIGVTFPQGAQSYKSSVTFTDWGTTLTTSPVVPPYITTAACSAASPTNDYLSTTIVSGGGTTNLTVALAASQSAVGQTAIFDDAPGFLAAARAASQSIAGVTGGVMFIPAAANLNFYWINSRLDLVSLGLSLSVDQQGIVEADESIVSRAHWYGTQSAQSLNFFQAVSAPQIVCNTVPCFYDPYEVPFIDHLTFNASGNSAVALMFDGMVGPIQGGNVTNVNCNTGTTSDYSGMCIVVRPGPYNFIMQNISIGGGPSNLTTAIDSTWTPSLYFIGDTGISPFSAVQYHLRDVQISARTMYMSTAAGTTGQSDEVEHVYAQGPLIPLLTLQNPGVNLPGINMRINDWTTDTSYVPSVNVLGALSVNLQASNIGVPSVDSGGVPGWISGRNLNSASFSNTPAPSAGFYTTSVTNDAIGLNTPSIRCPEGAAPSGIAGYDILYCDSTAHGLVMIPNNGAPVTLGAGGGGGGNVTAVATPTNGQFGIWTGPTTLSGTSTLESVYYADLQSGANCGAKINTADSALGATPGEIWVNRSCGLTTWSAVTLSANHTLRFIQGGTYNVGTIRLGAQSVITTANESGGASGQVVLSYAPSSGTVIQSSNTGSTINGVELRGFVIDCVGGGGNTAVGLDTSGVSNSNFHGISIIDCGTAHFANGGVGGSTVYDNFYDMSYGASNASSGFNGVFLESSANAQHWYGARFSRLATQFTIGQSGTATDQVDCFSCTFEVADTLSIDVVNAFGVTFYAPRFETIPLGVKLEAVTTNQIMLSHPYWASVTTQFTDLSTTNGYSVEVAYVGTPPVNAVPAYIATGSGSAATTALNPTCTPPTTNGQYVIEYNVTGGVSTAPSCSQVGIAPRGVTGTTDTILYSDNSDLVVYSGSATVAVTLPTPTTLLNTNFVTVLSNYTTTTVTVTPATFTISLNGATPGSSAVIPTTQQCSLFLDPNTSSQWDLQCSVPTSTGTGISGLTTAQVPIAGSSTTLTSSKALAGSGAGITTGPASGVSSGDVTTFTGTGGQVVDSTIPSANLITYASPATGIARTTSASQALVGSELSGDVTTSGSNAATVVQVEGAAIPVSAQLVGTNSSKQLVAATTPSISTVTLTGGNAFGDNSISGKAACETTFGITTLSGASTTTGLNCLPANSFILSVEYRVTTTITTAVSFTVGDSGSATRYCSTQSTLTSGTTGICTAAGWYFNGSAAGVKITPNTSPGAGAIRIIVTYITITAPTS